MKLAALQSLSPTLLGEMLKGHQSRIFTGTQVFNAKDCSLLASFKDKTTGNTYSLMLDELPEEIRKGIHDYTTRLIGEKNLIECALDGSKTTIA